MLPQSASIHHRCVVWFVRHPPSFFSFPSSSISLSLRAYLVSVRERLYHPWHWMVGKGASGSGSSGISSHRIWVEPIILYTASDSFAPDFGMSLPPLAHSSDASFLSPLPIRIRLFVYEGLVLFTDKWSTMFCRLRQTAGAGLWQPGRTNEEEEEATTWKYSTRESFSLFSLFLFLTFSNFRMQAKITHYQSGGLLLIS